MRRAFTLIEAMVATALTAIGVAAVAGAIGSVQHSHARIVESETMARMAEEKIQEIAGTGDYTTLDGSYEAEGLPYTWSATLDATGVENLEKLTVTITRSQDRDMEESASGLVYVPPVQGGGTN